MILCFSSQKLLHRLILCLCCSLFCLIASASPLSAQDMPIPVRIHVALLKKIFSFYCNFQDKPSPNVTIVYTHDSEHIKDEAHQAFSEIGIEVKSLTLEEALKGLGDADVVYVAPGAEGIQKICDTQGVFSSTGVPGLVSEGKVALGIGAESGKPKVYIHAPSARMQKQELTADLLRLAKVFE
ncbi:MAG: hypothetical protein EAZ92_14745 [Candidatus Kapaibacterium sp.]|nr:MAG: hypothetical protein EAZ92_14745 [Candidatus Kapabacteria bacterium]